MKKLGFIITLILTVSLPLFAEHVDPETARKVATTFLNNNGAKAGSLTDLSKEAGFTNLYIFNAEQGFVVMAADDCVKPILGYSLTGRFVTKDMPENISSWLQGYNEEIQYAIESNIKSTPIVKQAWTDLIDGSPRASKADPIVSPLIETRWNQGSPYNNLCPLKGSSRTLTGCVATAMAQIMNYWEYPATGIGSHSYVWNDQTLSANFGSTSYDWANMTNTYGSSSTQVQKEAVATLMYHCGVSVDMNYGLSGSGGSGAVTSDVALALVVFFNYKNTAEYKDRSGYTNDDWIAMLKTEMDATPRRPIQYRGRNADIGGHSFICDGYDSEDNFHFNWGWGGDCDGFYSIDEMTTGAPFTEKQGAIFGIEPSSCTLTAPGSLAYVIGDSRNVTLTWSSVTGAISYNIFRNDILIGNTTETTLVNTALYGDNNYYVRCVDANGLQSLASNIVTANIPYPTPTVNDLTATLSDNNVTLSWTAPDWCYPETPTSVLNYGEEPTDNVNACKYYAHRHIATDLASYQNQVLFKVSTFVFYAGTYSVYVYTGTTNGQPETLRTSLENITINGLFTWYDFILDNPVTISGEDDLWIIMKQENTGQISPVPSFNTSTHNSNIYYGDDNDTPTSISPIPDGIDLAWYINGYLTDGVYSYNIYDGSGQVASNVSLTSYSFENIANNTAHCYTIKTQFNSGETEASNMIGYTKGNASLTTLDLGTADMMTIAPNSTLTVTGSLTNTNADNLIIEDGAQLINESTGVKATVKKNITAYTSGADGWNFIASPVTETLIASEITGLITTDTYDFYYLDEGSEKWINYKENDQHTNIDPGFDIQSKKGYLYANSVDNTIEFEGTLQQNGSVSLAMTNNGWNLIGNPFTCDAYASQSFYRIVNGALDANIKDNTTSIPPCTGILVKATSDKATFTFSKTAPVASTNNGNLKIALTQATTTHMGTRAETLDKAFVSFNEGSELGKFYLGLQNANIYIPQNGEAYTIAYSEQQGEMPLCFKANQDGNYTITVNAENVNIGYLHLIDNIAGNDVDLIATPSYTFSANADDHESRFRLIFNANENTNSDTTDIMDGVTHILDVTGRIVATDLNTKLTPGVYILKNANNNKTKKIVIN